MMLLKQSREKQRTQERKERKIWENTKSVFNMFPIKGHPINITFL